MKKTKKFIKVDFKLPEDNLIFCSFNSNHKINPFIFNTWMNILKKLKKYSLDICEQRNRTTKFKTRSKKEE